MPLDFYVAHGPAGGSDDPLQADNPLGAEDHQVVLAENAALLAQRNWRRVLASHPGHVPCVDGVAYLFLGTHVLWKSPTNQKWPLLHLRGKVWPTIGETATATFYALRAGVVVGSNSSAHATLDDVALTLSVADSWMAALDTPGGDDSGPTPTLDLYATLAGSSLKDAFGGGFTVYLEEQP